MSGMFTSKSQFGGPRGGGTTQKRFGLESVRGRLNSQSSRGSSESSTHTGLNIKYKNPEKPEQLIERNRKTKAYDIERLLWRAGLECPNAVKEGLWDIGLIQSQKLFETCAMSLADLAPETVEQDVDMEDQLAANSTSLTKKPVERK